LSRTNLGGVNLTAFEGNRPALKIDFHSWG
jgi:hypothetical protein